MGGDIKNLWDDFNIQYNSNFGPLSILVQKQNVFYQPQLLDSMNELRQIVNLLADDIANNSRD
jgi:hypothetical protein